MTMKEKIKTVLFICVGNSCRSQMAEGFCRRYCGGLVECSSVGTKPAKEVNPLAVKAMEELGFDISGQVPKKLTPEMVDSNDILISMGCGVEDTCPAPLLKDFEDWEIEDPYGQSIEKYRDTRDKIQKKVKDLIEDVLGLDRVK